MRDLKIPLMFWSQQDGHTIFPVSFSNVVVGLRTTGNNSSSQDVLQYAKVIQML